MDLLFHFAEISAICSRLKGIIILDLDMQHENTACTCGTDMQHGEAAGCSLYMRR
jgi:hypothetical protein